MWDSKELGIFLKNMLLLKGFKLMIKVIASLEPFNTSVTRMEFIGIIFLCLICVGGDGMSNGDSSRLVLLVQNSHTVYCYFSISPITIKDFEDRYGENVWKNSKPVIKVYSIQSGSAEEVKTVYIDAFADNWFINLDKDDMNVFIKLGRILPDDTFAAIALSNTVTTPRSHQSNDTTVSFIDVSQYFTGTPDNVMPTYKEEDGCEANRKEPKPYPFKKVKKKYRGYPRLENNYDFCKEIWAGSSHR